MREQVRTAQAPPVPDADQRYEYLLLTVAPHERVGEARARLSEHAEYGKWELTRSVQLYGGARKYWLRRRVMRVRRTA
ncbi:hypothetical protein AS188_10725 [Kocuria flava]|uniref:Uncharacterized protein n=1 Tax=Kocuria flava TaxID=446860 RepID=A0A0U3I9Q7_9MICC|nr:MULTISPECIES: DUF5703 family protein [Kocuria]ALU40140.1 hypothetical protein AS188_10725 [Kocuria flava]MCD1143831.1 DUF5703 family protein [Kocuria sp. LUK]MCJ8503710.1 DUF5703 family protein [Kocuria flava]PLC12748.1 hypothetical protein AUQ48_11625 [Kocuria flava]GEO91020.1 hypothetical protein KFL01_03260 [Kocuria flava]